MMGAPVSSLILVKAENAKAPRREVRREEIRFYKIPIAAFLRALALSRSL
jgi:hypothetical protein